MVMTDAVDERFKPNQSRLSLIAFMESLALDDLELTREPDLRGAL